MNDTLISRYRRWYDYEKDSHALTLDSLRAVAEESGAIQEACAHPFNVAPVGGAHL